MLYVKADDESILSYGEEVQRRQTVFMPLDLSTVVLGIGITKDYTKTGTFPQKKSPYFFAYFPIYIKNLTECNIKRKIYNLFISFHLVQIDKQFSI